MSRIFQFYVAKKYYSNRRTKQLYTVDSILRRKTKKESFCDSVVKSSERWNGNTQYNRVSPFSKKKHQIIKTCYIAELLYTYFTACKGHGYFSV